jgi:hypothetical protein
LATPLQSLSAVHEVPPFLQKPTVHWLLAVQLVVSFLTPAPAEPVPAKKQRPGVPTMRHLSSPLSQSWPTSFESMSLSPGEFIIEVEVSKTMRMLGLTTWCWIRVTGFTSARLDPGSAARTSVSNMAAPAPDAFDFACSPASALRAPMACKAVAIAQGVRRYLGFRRVSSRKSVGPPTRRSQGCAPEIPQRMHTGKRLHSARVCAA